MSDPVTRLNAALEGRYAVERELGEGGMATVYLADDLKHERLRDQSTVDSPPGARRGEWLWLDEATEEAFRDA